MYKDIHRVEDGLIPALFTQLAFLHIEAAPNDAASYETMLDMCKKCICRTAADLPKDRQVKIYKRLDRIVTKILNYFIKNKFDTRKMFLAVSEWARALNEAGAIIIAEDSELHILLTDMHEIILEKGYGAIENFDKIDISAINHVPKLHKLAQAEGYYL